MQKYNYYVSCACFFIIQFHRIESSESQNLLSEILANRALDLSITVTSSRVDDASAREMMLRKDPSFESLRSDRYISKGLTSSTIIIRIPVINDTNEENFILNLGNSHLDHVELFQLSKPGSRKGGDFISFREWELSEIKISFPLQIPPGMEDVLLLKINTFSATDIKPIIETPIEFYRNLYSVKTLYAFFYGCILVMIVYNFIVYLLLGERVYLFYSAVIFFNLCLQIYLNGMDLFLVGDFPKIRNRIGILFVGLSAYFGVQFAREFLHTFKTMPRLDRVLFVFSVFALGYSIFSVGFLDLRYAILSANLIAQIFAFLILYTIIQGIVLKVRKAKLFLIAWGFLLLGIVLYSLLEAGAVPYNFFTVFSNQIGSVLEATILSIAMAERLRALKKEKEEAQQKAFENLEQIVQERTSQLNKTLREIQKDISMAKKIQADSLPDETWSSRWIQFARIFQPMSIIGGDTYDISKIEEGFYRVFIADATGHGVQAALVTMAIRSEYLAIKRNISSASEILKNLNDTFIREYNSLKIVFTCCVVDIDLNSYKIQFASAGHPPQLLVQKKSPVLLERTGRIIGLSLDSDYEMIQKTVQPGDRLYLYTDGILEQKDPLGNQFGENGFIRYLTESDEKNLKKLTKNILKEFDEFRKEKPILDDITFLCIEVL